MDVAVQPKQVTCRAHVVLKQDELIVCCELLRLFSSEQDGSWERFTCSQDVRAHRGKEMVWAEHAVYRVANSELVLTGRPRIRQGSNFVHGERIIMSMSVDRARVERPQGRVVQQAAPMEMKPMLKDRPLPETCPIPARARK